MANEIKRGADTYVSRQMFAHISDISEEKNKNLNPTNATCDVYTKCLIPIFSLIFLSK